jgi:alkylation response protein AidB-like acyl-CoA dehydrogenase
VDAPTELNDATELSDAAALRERAAIIADEVLFPAALAIDAADQVPVGHLDLLAAEGFYGPPQVDFVDFCRIVEVLASGCLATTFVWLQHFGAVRAAATSERPGIRDRWLDPLSRGVRRAGIALAALRPGTPAVRARAVDGGYLLDGEAPWVTGWGMIDTLFTAARDEADTVVWALLDAVPDETLSVQPLDLVAVNASRTVLVRFAGHFVPADRVTGTAPFAVVAAGDAAGLRLNGSLALGVTARCVRLLGPGRLDGALDECRAALDAGTPETMPQARAAASALAVRAAAALSAATGARAVMRGNHAERLSREALFLLVFGSRPAIKGALLRRLGGAG